MTLFYSHDGISTIIFRTNDDYPHISERKPGEPFLLFRIDKINPIAKTFQLPEVALVSLRHAVRQWQNEGFVTDWPDIADYDYKKREFGGIKASCFEANGYFVAATILAPEASKD